MAQNIVHEPYFFNPSMTPKQLEHWLNQQRIHMTHFNRLIEEKAALEQRLGEVKQSIDFLSSSGFEGKLSFPCDSNPLLENPQTNKQHQED